MHLQSLATMLTSAASARRQSLMTSLYVRPSSVIMYLSLAVIGWPLIIHVTSWPAFDSSHVNVASCFSTTSTLDRSCVMSIGESDK